MACGPAKRPLRIAVVYGRMPLPMTRADQMTVAHLLSFLAARGHQVDLFTLDSEGRSEPAHVDWLRRHTRRLSVIPHGRWAQLRGALAALLRGQPLQVGMFTSGAQRRAVRQALATGDYDVAYCYYIRSAEALRDIARHNASRDQRPQTIVAMQLSQALNTQRIARNSPSWRDRLLYGIESRLMRRYEARVWAGFSRTALIGRQDVEQIRDLCREAGLPEIDNHIYSPHGVDVGRFRPRGNLSPEPKTLVFNGVMGTNTNVDAILWFVRAVWPLVRREEPEVRLMIVGRRPRPEVVALGAQPGIEVTGEVPDPADYIARATVCINPMRAGAGMQNKLIEFLGSGKPVVATSVANEGIGGTAGEHLLIADAAEDFAAKVVHLLRHPEERARLGAAARAFILRSWTWEHHYYNLEADMLEALGEDDAAAVVRAERDRFGRSMVEADADVLEAEVATLASSDAAAPAE